MLPPDLPRYIRIGFRNYTVRSYAERGQRDCGELGSHAPFDGAITLTDAQPPAELANTLLHEILHGVWKLYELGGDAAQEERAVSVLANAICALILDNPALFPWLTRQLQQDATDGSGQLLQPQDSGSRLARPPRRRNRNRKR